MSDEKKAPTCCNPVEGSEEALNTHLQYPHPRQPLLSRERRILEGLTAGPKTREQVDRLGRVSNGPEYIRQLRARGLVIHCERRCFTNEEGNRCCPGVYQLDERSVPRALEMLGQIPGDLA